MIYRYLDGINQAFPDVVYEVNSFVADIKFVKATTHRNTLYTNRKADYEHFFWYDELHPSLQVDKAIAKEFINVIKGTSKYATYW
jgi:hypothetical protein